jgi:hypothetical protein
VFSVSGIADTLALHYCSDISLCFVLDKVALLQVTSFNSSKVSEAWSNLGLFAAFDVKLFKPLVDMP